MELTLMASAIEAATVADVVTLDMVVNKLDTLIMLVVGLIGLVVFIAVKK